MVIGLDISIEKINNNVVFRLDGRLDAATVPMLEKRINSLKNSRVFLDFSKVDYLSSAGLRLLLSKDRKFKSEQRHLAIFSINEDVLEIIKLAGFDTILSIYNTETEALQA